MMKKYAVAAAFAGSLLAAPAFAQDATSCEAMLTDFDSHLASNNVQADDERVSAARTEAEQACMAGDMTAAEESLDRAVAELGIPPRPAKATGGDTGATEAQGQTSQGSDTNTTTGTDTSGGASGSTTTGTTGTTGSGTDTTGSGTDTSGQSGSTSTTQ